MSANASDDECLLAELQENNARKELTGAERKAFAAEVGRLLEKASENGNSQNNGSFPKEKGILWIDELSKNTGMERRTIQNWWSAFTQSAGLNMTPKQAGEVIHRLFLPVDKSVSPSRVARHQTQRQRPQVAAGHVAGAGLPCPGVAGACP